MIEVSDRTVEGESRVVAPDGGHRVTQCAGANVGGDLCGQCAGLAIASRISRVFPEDPESGSTSTPADAVGAISEAWSMRIARSVRGG